MYAENVDIDGIRSIFIQETKFRDKLEEYCNELSAAIAELDEQKKYKGDEQGSEWKTRYEIQQEVNEQLRKQSVILHEKVATAAKTTHDFQKIARTNAAPDAFGLTPVDMLLDSVEKEKRSLAVQLLNIELRIEQEAKAYHKANEERKAVQLEIGTVNAQLSSLKGPAPPTTGTTDSILGLTAAHGNQLPTSQRAKSGGGGGIAPKNIPPNQRVIDPKLGPIKKAAAVKQLPPL